jgi:transcriptional regulator with XRE-family HTH domain
MERPSPLRARRLLRGLRLRDVERATGIADTVLSRLERGEAVLLGPRLRRLAQFYATPAGPLADEMRRWAYRGAPPATHHAP